MENRCSKKVITTLRDNIVSPEETSEILSCNIAQNVSPLSKSKTFIQDPRKPSSRKTYINQCDCMNRGSFYPSCCSDFLESIEEDWDREELVTLKCRDVCDSPPPSSASEQDDDPCAEFFNAMRGAVKNSVEDMFGRYFVTYLEKLDNLAKKLECTRCKMTKFYNDLNDKIALYGDRNSRKFQYLCLRIEHDHLFYRQLQKYFLKCQNRPSYTLRDKREKEQNPNEVKKSGEPQAETVFTARRSGDVRYKDKAPEKRDDKVRSKLPEVRSQEQIGDQNRGGKKIDTKEPEKWSSYKPYKAEF